MQARHHIIAPSGFIISSGDTTATWYHKITKLSMYLALVPFNNNSSRLRLDDNF